MAQPQVSWWNYDNTFPITEWDLQTVDAGSPSDILRVLIWNNRGNADTDLSDMTNTTITTKDTGGGNSGKIIEETWVKVQVNSDPNDGTPNEGTYHDIGGTVTYPLRADDPNVTSSGIIKGTKNDSAKTRRGNFCDVSLKAVVPGGATAGLVNFLTRVSYQYV